MRPPFKTRGLPLLRAELKKKHEYIGRLGGEITKKGIGQSAGAITALLSGTAKRSGLV